MADWTINIEDSISQTDVINKAIGAILASSSDSVVVIDEGDGLQEKIYILVGQHNTFPAALVTNCTLTSAQVKNHIFTNSGAAGSITINLPAAMVGDEVTFFIVAAQNMVINPVDSDIIDTITNAVGNSATIGGTAGTFLTLWCYAAGHWAAIGINGSVTDTD